MIPSCEMGEPEVRASPHLQVNAFSPSRNISVVPLPLAVSLNYIEKLRVAFYIVFEPETVLIRAQCKVTA